MIQTNQAHIDYAELMDEIGQSPEALAKLKETGDYTGMTKSVKTILDGRNRAAAISSPAGSPSDPHLHAESITVTSPNMKNIECFYLNSAHRMPSKNRIVVPCI
jgi:hypothetical protein